MNIVLFHLNNFFSVSTTSSKYLPIFHQNLLGFVRKVLEIGGPEILEISDEFGWMPLHYAAHLGNVDAVELILKTTSSLAYIKDNQGMSPIHISARNGKSRILKRIIEARPDVCELLDIKGRTALHVAVDNGQKKAIKTLLDMTPFDDLINEQDLEGNTALHVAAIHANFEIVVLVALDNRVDKGIVNNMEMTAFDIFTESAIELTQMGMVCTRYHNIIKHLFHLTFSDFLESD